MKHFYLLLAAFLLFNVSNAQIINFPDANFKAKLLLANTSNHIAEANNHVSIKIDLNDNGEIEVVEAANVISLDVNYSNITSITGIEYFTNLKSINCFGNSLGALNMVHPVLETLRVELCRLSSLNVSQCPQLKNLDCTNNQLQNLNVSNNSLLQILSCAYNQLSSLDLSSNPELTSLACPNNVLTILNLSGSPLLNYLHCSNNLLTNLDFTACHLISRLRCNFNQLTVLNLNDQPNLYELYCTNNNLTSIQFNQEAHLGLFYCDNNNLSQLNLTYHDRIYKLSCKNNQITQLSLANLSILQELYCDHNLLTNLDVSQNPQLTEFTCSYNQLTSIQFHQNGYRKLNCNNNNLTQLDLAGIENLNFLNCNYNQLTSLDISHFSYVYSLRCDNNLLVDLNIKNGEMFEQWFSFANNPTLEYICSDAEEVANVEDMINAYSYADCHVNTYCSFTPGGEFYTIEGANRYDSDNNGCDPADTDFPNFKLSFSDGTNSGYLIPDSTGNYHYDVQAGVHTIMPILENPSYFSVSPTTATVFFPNVTNPIVQNFCIAPAGSYNDMEISLLPLDIAQPGFDANYKIIYKNKGTTTQNGTVNLTFDDAVLDLVTVFPAATSQSLNNLNWEFTNLLPFEIREIIFTLNLNSPLELPAVNLGDILPFVATVTGAVDETPIDNVLHLNQIVNNSFDPNDKTCLEGNLISPEMVGKYVHYLIRFENTGTANAENVVVKDIIDTTKFDISTLVPLHGSDSFVTRISNSNQVEFIFENINLPFDDANNDGYVAFKIKTMPTLVLGDTFSNSANIYFDYNFPVVTNTATTTIQTLANTDFQFNNLFSLSPVPTKDTLAITTKQATLISSISIYNVLGQLVQVTTNPNEDIDVSDLKSGNYFITIFSDKGSATSKFIKE